MAISIDWDPSVLDTGSLCRRCGGRTKLLAFDFHNFSEAMLTFLEVEMGESDELSGLVTKIELGGCVNQSIRALFSGMKGSPPIQAP